MILTFIYLFALLVALGQASDLWYGASVSISENPLSDPWISHVYTTLMIPPAPDPQQNVLSLWLGLYTTGVDGEGRVQTLVSSFADPATYALLFAVDADQTNRPG